MTLHEDTRAGVVRPWVFLIFCLALVPIGVGEVSVNYVFLMVPLTLVLVRGKVEDMPELLRLAAVFYVLVFIMSSVMMIDQLDLLVRRFSSFLIFMTVFAFALVRIDSGDTKAFKLALVVVGVAFSLQAIWTFLRADAQGPLHFEAKNLVGSQRYGFVYVAGLWVLLLERWHGFRQQMLRMIGLAVLVAGVGLTFSRSSFVALAGSLILFLLVRSIKPLSRLEIRLPGRRALAGLAFALVALALTVRFFPLTIEFYSTTLLAPIADARIFQSMSQADSSEGIRVVRVLEVVDLVTSYPLTGTGYLGIWSFSPTGGGSAHNQLLDVLLRVGVVGFVFYLVVLATMMRYLARAESGLFWGMVAILIYGFFHETFKESQGAFILAFLVGLMAQDWRDRHLTGARRVSTFAPQTVTAR